MCSEGSEDEFDSASAETYLMGKSGASEGILYEMRRENQLLIEVLFLAYQYMSF